MLLSGKVREAQVRLSALQPSTQTMSVKQVQPCIPLSPLLHVANRAPALYHVEANLPPAYGYLSFLETARDKSMGGGSSAKSAAVSPVASSTWPPSFQILWPPAMSLGVK